MVKYKVTLRAKEREELLEITKGGKHNSKKIIHALILLNCDEGKYSDKVKNADISKVLKIGMRTIDRIKKKFVEDGFEIALEGKPTARVYEKKTDGDLEAHLIAMSCGTPPKGFARWSLRLLAEKAIELEYVENISHETVRSILKKTS